MDKDPNRVRCEDFTMFRFPGMQPVAAQSSFEGYFNAMPYLNPIGIGTSHVKQATLNSTTMLSNKQNVRNFL
jgi:hypothetical protein